MTETLPPAPAGQPRQSESAAPPATNARRSKRRRIAVICTVVGIGLLAAFMALGVAKNREDARNQQFIDDMRAEIGADNDFTSVERGCLILRGYEFGELTPSSPLVQGTAPQGEQIDFLSALLNCAPARLDNDSYLEPMRLDIEATVGSDVTTESARCWIATSIELATSSEELTDAEIRARFVACLDEETQARLGQ